jgi:ferredoxin-NADP reductase
MCAHTMTRPPPPQTFKATLVSSRDITPRVKELIFERQDGPFTFQSGQWASLVLPLNDEKGRPLRRSYSIASVPHADSSRFELVVTKVDGGVGSTWLHDAQVGTELEVKAPQGLFLRPAEVGPSLFIATGTGVAPFRGMLNDALAAARGEPLWILFGVRSLADAMYKTEFEALAAKHPRVGFELTMSRPDAGWTGRVGYVQKHVLELWQQLSAHGAPHAYICGVKKMLLEVRDVLKSNGVERQQLHLESYD